MSRLDKNNGRLNLEHFSKWKVIILIGFFSSISLLGFSQDGFMANPAQHKKQAEMQVRQLENYLRVIVSKDKSLRQVNNAIKLALTLFVSEKAIVQVSSKNRKSVRTFTIKEYLERMKMLKQSYTSIHISWNEIILIENYIKGEDGNYYTTVKIEQKFIGYNENRIVYKDLTKKDLKLVAAPDTKSYRGQDGVKYWEIKLSDILVTDTQDLNISP